MSDADFVLRDRGVSRSLDAYVVGGAVRPGGQVASAWGTGTVQVVAGAAWLTVEAHEAAVLALADAGAGW